MTVIALNMEKTIPRQFFDRIYGGDYDKNNLELIHGSHLNNAITDSSAGHRSFSESSTEVDRICANTVTTTPRSTPAYMNGFASFCEYSTPES